MEEYLKGKAQEVEALLEKYIDQLPKKVPTKLAEAMKYSLMAGGKRLRPVMLREAARVCGLTDMEETDVFAVAMEMIHTFSLIHDDLPAIDNDSLRRGKPTNHTVYGEATAILAGDGLLAYAAELMSKYVCTHTKKRFAEAERIILSHSGISGMIGGETVDVLAEKEGLDLSEEKSMLTMYKMKTCDLLIASLMAGAVIADADKETVDLFGQYGLYIGLAFQITDDILDITGDEAVIGKNVGSDEENNKQTYVSIVGIDKARAKAAELSAKAKSIANEIGSEFFSWLADYLAGRKY